MLRERIIFFIALIVFSLIAAPAQAVRAENILAGDRYEPDNTAGQAKVIASGTSQTRSIDPETDFDWIKFQVSTSSAVLLETTGPYESDTRITLYTSTQNPLEVSDDEGVNFYSFIDRLCNDDPLPAGTYYVRVEEYLQNAKIPSYDLFFQASPCPAQIVDMYVGPEREASSTISPHQSTRRSIPWLNNGPLRVINTGGSPIMAAERVIYKVNGIQTSFSEMMGLPANQLDTTYWLPWYNNVDLDTQLRFANVSGTTATVNIYVANNLMPGSPFTLLTGASLRKSFPNVNNGPVRIESNVPIVAAERVIYKVAGKNTSFSETMALPNSQLDTNYWLPWYNNVDLDTQLRFANVSGTTASVNIFIGGSLMPGSPFSLAPGASLRKSFAGINRGPVQIVSTQNIIAAERVIYKVNNVATSFSELMALPNSQLNTVFWVPWYNNVDLDTQLRFGMP